MSKDRARMFTVEEVAAMLSVSKMTVYRRIHAEELRAYRVGRSLRVRSDDLQTYLSAVDTFTWDLS